jgi:hypothetical protein
MPPVPLWSALQVGTDACHQTDDGRSLVVASLLARDDKRSLRSSLGMTNYVPNAAWMIARASSWMRFKWSGPLKLSAYSL